MLTEVYKFFPMFFCTWYRKGRRLNPLDCKGLSSLQSYKSHPLLSADWLQRDSPLISLALRLGVGVLPLTQRKCVSCCFISKKRMNICLYGKTRWSFRVAFEMPQTNTVRAMFTSFILLFCILQFSSLNHWPAPFLLRLLIHESNKNKKHNPIRLPK